MRSRLRFILPVVLLVLATMAAALWVRSFFRYDWVLRVRDDARTIHQVGAATSSGTFGMYVGHNQSADPPGMPRTLWQYNVQDVNRPQIYPLSSRGLRVLGFGWLWERDTPTRPGSYHWIWQVTAPGWFVALVFGLPGWMLLRRELRRHRAMRDGLCLNCGYDLRASAGRCPECGAVAKNVEPAA